MIDPRLQGRTVLVTGANNPFGIGAAVALAFARLGAKLFLHYHSTPPGQMAGSDFYLAQQSKSCDEVMQQIAAVGTTAGWYEADFTDLGTIPKVFDAAERSCGSIDVLVNNAATWRADTFLPGREPRRNPFVELWTNENSPMRSETSKASRGARPSSSASLESRSTSWH
jgi:NAD(P)-dependent dehydrogenase (short-subunit alcohol dehydrogenase family)